MNANELADWIKVTDFYEYTDDHLNDTMDEVAILLRQQQEKITKYELRNEEQRNRIAHLEAEIELTDEEKWELWSECPNGLVYDRVMMFADLILRKAQEK